MAHKNLVEMFQNRVAESGSAVALRYRVEGEGWKDVTWLEFRERSRKIASGLAALGVESGDRVALMSNTRLEWPICDFGILLAGAVTVPIYQSSTAEQAAYILNNCEAKVVICEDPSQVEKILEHHANLPTLKNIVYIDSVAQLEKADAKGRKQVKLDEVASGDNAALLSLSKLMEDGKAHLAEKKTLLDERARLIGRDNLATLVYTSGTTGNPKGVMLTHGNFLFEVEAARVSIDLGPEDLQFLFLPLAHIFAKVLMMVVVDRGVTTALDGSVTHVVRNLGEIKPTFMGAVPRVYEKAYNNIKANMQSATGAKKKIADWAIGVGKEVSKLRQQNKQPSGLLALQHKIADAMVFSKIKARFGGRIRFFVSGGAPLAREIAEFLHAADMLVLEGYGLTETTAATHVNRPDQFKFGTVGPALPGVETKIAEDGEILLAGPNILQGYYKLPEETAKALETIDGKIWFHTGDIGEIDDKGMVRITDRKKDLFKTSGGKYIAPQVIENALKVESKYISQVMVYGENRNFVTALMTLNEENIAVWAKDNGLGSSSIADLSKNPKVIALLQSAIDAVNKGLGSWETVKKFAIVYPDFTIETGELTPTLKVKRKAVIEKYKHILDGFYGGDKE